MLAKLPIDKFAEGFVIECEAMGVDPDAVVKVAQIINTRIPGHSSRQGSGMIEDAFARHPTSAINLTKLNPATAVAGGLANVGELGSNVNATGRAAQGANTWQRINFLRQQRGLRPLTPEEGQPMQRTTGREQFHRELGSYIPGQAMGQSLDKATQQFQEQFEQAKRTGARKYGPEWWALVAKNYGKGLVQGVVPTEKYKEHMESGRDWWRRARSTVDPEYKKRLAREAEEKELLGVESDLSTGAQEEERQQMLAKRRFSLGQRRLQAKYDKEFREWNARRLAAEEAGQEFKEPQPQKPDIQWSPEGKTERVRRRPLLWSSPLQRRRAGRI
jgi:hypothetical protein